MLKRRVFSREFKTEAVQLVVERGVKVSQASTDLAIHVNVLRKWLRDLEANPAQSFPGRGRMKPDDAEVARLRRELAKTKAERETRVLQAQDPPGLRAAPQPWSRITL